MAFVVSRGQVAELSRPRIASAVSMNLTSDYSLAYGKIWQRHGSVQTVVNFLGRNVASLGLHLFRRVGDSDRERVRDHPVSRLFSKPAPGMTPYAFMDAMVRDLAIYDRYLALKVKTDDGLGALLRIPPTMWSVSDKGTWYAAESFKVAGAKGEKTYKADDVVAILGYSPDAELGGVSSLESLRQVLAEEYEAARMRQQTFRNGARASGYLERPAPLAGQAAWSKEARDRFRAGWRAQYTGGGPEAGGTPILEDGMKFSAAQITAKDLQYIESRKLTREEVASAYFIPPPMVGILDNATFSNIKEQHKHLYQDTLGPWLQRIQQELMRQVVPEFDGSGDLYLEFNLEEKMRGSFEDQAAQLQTSVGGPWMLRNEARAMRNLPAIEGGDELIVPLNVIEGGQASPRDSAPESGAAAGPRPVAKLGTVSGVKAPEPTDEDRDRAVGVMRGFFRRQGSVVASLLGAGSVDWWDSERWDAELADDLFRVLSDVSGSIGPAMAAELGFDPGAYDMDRTLKFLRAVAKSRAGAVNAATWTALLAPVADDSDDSPSPAAVFADAEESRSITAGQAIVTTAAGFAAVEAGRQMMSGRKTFKQWVVTSSNPRSEHAAMNGETVPIDQPFSNGMDWPGDPTGGAENVANCRCRVDVIIEE
ncbi:phage portal protein [Glutamicibacter arilaitensis]|uniref:phage portal protein n=1 Tax=Glutamicibacter arilaitensis TaxID=256701 RepID=UPI003FD58B2D